mgnify:CR=1 FL=1
MKNKQENFESEKVNKHDGEEAYQTLRNWVKSVPNAIKEIEESGTEEELIRYKRQIKMVVQKLQEIEDKLLKK